MEGSLTMERSVATGAASHVVEAAQGEAWVRLTQLLRAMNQSEMPLKG